MPGCTAARARPAAVYTAGVSTPCESRVEQRKKGAQPMRVLIAAGGTAGHINPALAIAGALKKADPAAEIHFAGRREGMEYGLVTKAGYPFHHIEINGFQRKLTAENIRRNVLALWHLALSGPRTAAILREVQPDLVIGCGGYVSGPIVRAAAKKGIHTAIHEQNAFPGVTNKLLAKDVDVVLAASADAVEKLGAPDKTVVVGNPVRPELLTQDRAAARAKIGAKDPYRDPELWRQPGRPPHQRGGRRAPAAGNSRPARTYCTCTPPAAAACSCFKILRANITLRRVKALS